MTQEGRFVGVEGFPFPVWASPGLEGKARELGGRCRAARAFLCDHLGVTPPVVLWVLARADWDSSGGDAEYGMPNFHDGGLYVAGERADFWAGLAEALSGAPSDVRREVERTYGARGAIDLAPFFDLLVVHELTHAFLGELPHGLGRRWLDEFFCNLALHAYVAVSEPADLPRLTVFPRAFLSLDASGFRHDLAYFESVYSGMPSANYAWYQCRLHVAAAEVHHADGVGALRRLWRFRAQDDARLAAQLKAEVGAAMASVLTTWPP